jgi:hypothetical protein
MKYQLTGYYKNHESFNVTVSKYPFLILFTLIFTGYALRCYNGTCAWSA